MTKYFTLLLSVLASGAVFAQSQQAVRDQIFGETDAESAKQSLIGVQGEIRKLKAERDSMLAKMQSAQARIRIQQQLDGLSVEADVKALENVREHISKLHAEASYNNSVSNKFNPNPNRWVYNGNMTWEEMMSPFYSVLVPVDVQPRQVLKRGTGNSTVE